MESDFTQQITLLTAGSIISLVSIAMGALLNHFLENSRTRQRIIIDKKLEIYSEIITKIQTFLQDDGLLLPSSSVFTNFEARIRLIRVISRGRLLAGKELEIKLRDYYDVVTKWLEIEKQSKEEKSVGNLMNQLALEIEQLMREELGVKRVLSNYDIKKHVYNS